MKHFSKNLNYDFAVSHRHLKYYRYSAEVAILSYNSDKLREEKKGTQNQSKVKKQWKREAEMEETL